MRNSNKTNNLIKESAIINRVIHFIKYHNAFTIGLMLVFIFTGAIFASEDLRDTIIGEEIVSQTGVDNTALLAADLSVFDLAMTIDAVSEDENKYYIDYSFKTLGIKDNIWQELTRVSRMTIAKLGLAGRDLGLYVAEELGEIADYELAYLQEVQTAEREKGETRTVETTEYTGLIGLVLNSKEKVLPGYVPVVEPAQIVVYQSPESLPTPEPQPQPEPPASAPEPQPEPSQPEPEPPTLEPEPQPPTPEPICSADHLDLCINQELCQGINLYWYNDVCNLEPEPEQEPEPQPVCDIDHLDLCISQELCEGVSLYWYNNVCNLEPQVEPEPEPEPEPEILEIF